MSANELSGFLTDKLKTSNLTVKDLAEKAEMPYETVRRAVHGIGSTTLETTTKLVRSLGFSIALEPVEAQ